jgi:hypothetical protein
VPIEEEEQSVTLASTDNAVTAPKYVGAILM